MLAGLALVGSLLWLPGRGAAQAPAAPAVPPPGSPATPGTPGTSPSPGTPAPQQGGTAQPNQPNQPDQQNPPNSTQNNQGTESKKAPPPANPLVLVNPEDGSGNSNALFDDKGNPISSALKKEKTQQDYRHDATNDRQSSPAKGLSLFGYDFFRSARDLIRARRNYLLQRYNSNNLNNPNSPYNPNNPYRAVPTEGYATEAQGGVPTNRRMRGTETPSGQLNGATVPNGNSPVAPPGYTPYAPPNTTLPLPTTPAPSTNNPASLNSTPTPTSNNTQVQNTVGTNYGDDRDFQIRGPLTDAGDQNQSLTRHDLSGDSMTDIYNSSTPNTETNQTGIPYPEDNTQYQQPGFQPDTNAPIAPVEGQVNPYQVSDPLSQMFHNPIASVPLNYQLAPGDTLAIRYWSPTLEPRLVSRTVDERGDIVVDALGPIVVRGLTADGVEKALRAQLRRYYKDVDVSVTLSRLRTIQVTVSGFAFEPGTFQVPANATAYNVLWIAGGPTFDGTLRSIEVRRQGRLIGTLDVYKFLMVGSQGSDIPLQTGDLITIPPRQSEVAVRGEVLHPAVYELASSESLPDALHYAGGIKASAVDQRIHITTLVPGTSRVIKDVDLKSESVASNTRLYDGDTVDVLSVRPLLVNKVAVEGAVDQPSEYEMVPGMRLSDLLDRARGLISEAYPLRADLYRWNPDNTTTLVAVNLEKALAHDPTADLTLQRWDRLRVYTRQEVSWTGRRTVTVRGAVQRNGAYDYSDNMRLRDLLLMAGGPTPDAYLDRAVLEHQHGDGTYDLNFVSIAQAIKGDPRQNVAIQDNDILAVYRNDEAHFEPEHFVTIRGDVVAQGVYPRSNSMRVSDLMTLAGGFRPGGGTRVVLAHARRPADTHGMLLARNLSFDAQGKCAPQDDVPLEDGDVLTVQGTGGWQDKPAVVIIRGAVERPGPIILENKQMRLTEALKQAGGLRPESFPEGTEFRRDPTLLATAGQKDLAFVIAQLSNLLNESDYKTKLALTTVEALRATSQATQGGDLSAGLLGASTPSPASNPAATNIATTLTTHDLVNPPRELGEKELEPNGNLAVNLPAAMQRPGGRDDLLLMDGDTIYVPEKPTTIQVVGAVVNGRGILYKPGAPLSYYVDQTGGFTVDAAKDKIVIIHAGGGLIPGNRVREMRPGDVIFVPTKVLAEKISNNQNAFDSIFRSLTGSAVTVLLATKLFGL
jgi:protein involved in polysaccharide export with SLBB domain